MIDGKCIKIIDSEIDYTIRYRKKTIKNSLIPITGEISGLLHENKNGCTIIGISGPPGSGKSSIAAVLRKILSEQEIDAAVLPIDGFHFPNVRLKEMTASGSPSLTSQLKNCTTLYQRKGAKETYDTADLIDSTRKLKGSKEFYWPVYSRITHDPVPEGILISNPGKPGGLFIIEGNYLFLKAPPWSELRPFFDMRIFISSRKRLVKKRIIKRKQMGGFSRREALAHFRRSDSLNFNEVIKDSTGFDYILDQKSKYSYVLRKNI